MLKGRLKGSPFPGWGWGHGHGRWSFRQKCHVTRTAGAGRGGRGWAVRGRVPALEGSGQQCRGPPEPGLLARQQYTYHLQVGSESRIFPGAHRHSEAQGLGWGR